MFEQPWKKYMPVILILLKRAANGDQVLQLNQIDFDRAAAGRRVRYIFNNLRLKNGRVENQDSYTPLSKEFVAVIQQDEKAKKFVKDKEFEFSLGSDLLLNIRQTNIVTVTEEDVAGGQETTA